MPTSGTLEKYQPLSIYTQQQEQMRSERPTRPARSTPSYRPQAQAVRPTPVRMSKAEALTIVQRLKRVVLIGSLLFFGTVGTLIAGHAFESARATSSVHSTTTAASATKTVTATSTASSSTSSSSTASNSTSTQGGSYGFGSSSSSNSPVSGSSVS